MLTKRQRSKTGRAPSSAAKAAPSEATLSTKVQSAMRGAVLAPVTSTAPLPSAAPPQFRMVRPESVTARGSELLKVMRRDVPLQSTTVRDEPLVEPMESSLPCKLRSCALPGPRSSAVP